MGQGRMFRLILGRGVTYRCVGSWQSSLAGLPPWCLFHSGRPVLAHRCTLSGLYPLSAVMYQPAGKTRHRAFLCEVQLHLDSLLLRL